MADEAWRQKPDPIPRKPEIEAWYSSATPGERDAFDRAATEIRHWQGEPSNAWFGVSITPDRIWDECVSAAEKYGVPHGAWKFLFRQPMIAAGQFKD